MKLHFQTLGHGKPLVILHGLFGSSANWRQLAARLSDAGRRVISVDLRNHGQSPHSMEQDYSLMAADIHALCDTLELERVVLLGHSLGGKVAMQFAEMYPQRLDRLIVVDMSPRIYEDEHSALIDAMMQLDLSRYASRREVDQALAETIGDNMVRRFLLMNLATHGECLQWTLNLPALQANYPELCRAVLEHAHIEVPTLFIRGSDSDYINHDDEALIQSRFSRAMIETVDGAGHWVHADRPGPFLDLVTAFMGAHET